MRPFPRRLLQAGGAGAAAGAAVVAYGSAIERNLFTLRQFDVPVLGAGARPIRLLHLSDVHIVPNQSRKKRWIAALARLRPDLVVSTGDHFGAVDAIPAVLEAFEPLFDFPGAFVPGNNDYFGPVPKNPSRYFKPSRKPVRGPRLPWPDLADKLAGRGWCDLTHVRTTLTAAGRTVALTGVDDPYLRRARYSRVAGAADQDAAVRIGVAHAPEPYILRQFAADRYDLTLAGHTHGGQVRVPFGPAIVTNCGIDVHRARWLHRWDEHMWFHVCAGLGTNRYLPIRFACRPEASLLTLVPRS